MTASSKRLKTLIAAISIAVAIVFAMAGCVAEPNQTAGRDEQIAATADVGGAPEETEIPAPEYQAGDVIDADAAMSINGAWGKLSDDKAYPMPDGSYVLVKGGEPVPQAVLEAAVEAVAPLAAANADALEGALAETQQALLTAAADEATKAGRTAAVVWHSKSWDISAGTYVPVWLATGATTTFSSRDEAVDFAQQWVDVSPGTRTMIVIG